MFVGYDWGGGRGGGGVTINTRVVHMMLLVYGRIEGSTPSRGDF